MKKKRAIHAAVAAIYFSDSSDYGSALWSVIDILDPKMCALLADDERAAFKKSAERVGIEVED